jgi:hypothetical protein
MRHRWALAVVGALLFGAAACANAPASPGPSASSPNGLAALTAAAAKTHGQSYQFAVSYGTMLTAEGVATGDGAATSMKVTFADPASGVVAKIDGLVLKNAVYAKLDLGPAAGTLVGISPNTWIHIDPAKAPGAGRLGIAPGQDIFGPDTYIKAVTSANVVSSTLITGKLDPTRTTLPGLSATPIATTGGWPFGATLDDQGRITKIVVSVPAMGTAVAAADLTSQYSNWETKVDATPPPAAQTVEAPALIYTFLQ